MAANKELFMEAPAKRIIAFDEYLAIEAETGMKHEYFDGEVFAMAGGSANHTTLQFNLGGLLHVQLRGGPCRGFASDQRIGIELSGLYTYPDLSVACGESEIDPQHTLKNPTLIAEVLSPSTEGYDRGAKFHMYRQLPSLRHYLLISQDQQMVHLFTREQDGRWTFEEFTDSEATIPLPAIDCKLKVAELYERVELPESAPRPPGATGI